MKKLFFILFVAMVSFVVADTDNRNSDVNRTLSTNEVVFALKTTQRIQATNISALNAILPRNTSYNEANTSILFTFVDDNGDVVTVFEHRPDNHQDLSLMISSLQSVADVKWASPNYVYVGDPREDIANDPKLGEQYHHPVMKNPEAWEITQGSGEVIVAVTDDGVDIDHVDLKNRMWKNEKEIAGNGIDDDNNGYIDDHDGWDFSSNDNTPHPMSGDSHGTHVAGIIVAERNNKTGICGTAPGVKVMPIRFYGSGSWTSTVVAKSYAYAVDNGAKIITTSFNIDGFVGDPIYESSLKYVYQNGVLLFNSAGNGSQAEPRRQAFHQLLLVASTIADQKDDDEKSSFSNWGTGVDISAPGGGGNAGILSTLPGNEYGRKSGTSMASPNAAAVAAMIWSKNPEWSREQVVAHLYRSSDDINEINSKYKNLLGPGRVNTFSAIHQPTLAPRIIGLQELAKKSIPILSNVTELTVSVIDLLDKDSAENVANWKLENKDTGETITLSVKNAYLIGSNYIKFGFSQLAPGNYQFTGFAEKLHDPFGTKIEEDFIVEFSVNK